MGKDPIKKTTLKNGLRVIAAENHSSRVVSLQFWVGAGSAQETNDQAGTAHFIEHMLFKGTDKRGVGKIAEGIEGCGGEINAYTSLDQTVYYLVIASRYHDAGLDILADAVLNARFDPDEIEKERGVILEEIKRSEDTPSSVLDKMLFATSFKIHNYRRPVIGFENTVKRLTREDLLAFRNTWYTAGNCFLVAAGDFEMEPFLRRVESTFAALPPGTPSELKAAAEMPQEMVRVKTETMPIEETYLAYAFPIPPFAHPDVAALDILDIVLGQGESSRLYSELKLSKNIVNGVAAGSFTPKDPGLFIVNMELDAQYCEQALRESLEIVRELKREGVRSAELDKAKAIVESQIIHEVETVQGLASKLGSYELFAGDISYEDRYLQLLMSTTVHDVQRVAQKYLDFSRLNLVGLFPKKDAAMVDKAALGSIVRAIDEKPAGVRDQTAAPAIDRGDRRDKEVIKKTLATGTNVIVKENRRVNLFSACLVFKGGVRYENENNNGVSNFMTNMLVRGTKNLNAKGIAEFFESRGAAVRPFSGKNTFGLKVTGLSRYFDELFDMMMEMLSFPAFDYDEIQKERRSILEAIKAQEDDLPTVAFNAFSRVLYEFHPYALNVLGDERTVTHLSRGEIVSFYERYAQASNLTLAIVGDISAEDVVAKVEAKIKMLRSSKVAVPLFPPQKPIEGIRKKVIYKDKQQAHIVLGFPGTTFDNPDRFALEVLNAIFSSMSGRLFTELRDKQGLCYSVSSVCQEGIDPGYFAFYIATGRSKIEDAIGAIVAEIRRAMESPPIDEEMERVKKYIVGNHEIALQRNEAQASHYAFNDKYGRSLDEIHRFPENIMAVTKEDVLRVARAYLNPEKYVIAIVRPND